jgi:PmbA protein
MSDSMAERVLELAAKAFDAAEVFEEIGETVSVGFQDNRLKEIHAEQRHGVGLRVIHQGRIGFAATSDLRRPSRLIEMAAASALYGDEAKFEFPGKPDRLTECKVFDERVPAVSAEQMVEMGREGLEMSRSADEGYLYGAGLGRGVSTIRILNTSGLDYAFDGTGMSASVDVQEVRDDGLLSVYEYMSWGQPIEGVADLTRTVLDKMRQASVVVQAKVEAMPMIFTKKALGNLFMPIAVALNGKNVHKGSSALRGKIGQQVLDERLTVTDDPSVDFAPASCPIDGEGTPTRKQAIFENGVLKTYLADLQTAGLLGIEPTGHGFRTYTSRPGPSDTNTVLSAGETSYADMVSGMRRGLIVDETLGSGQSNLLAGEFSVNVALGFLVRDGRVAGRVKDCMVAGNVYEVLKKLEAIGSEREWHGSSYVPPIMVGGLKLAAQG